MAAEKDKRKPSIDEIRDQLKAAERDGKVPEWGELYSNGTLEFRPEAQNRRPPRFQETESFSVIDLAHVEEVEGLIHD